MYAVLCATPCASVSANRTFTSVWKWNPSTRETLRMEIGVEELQLPARNHGLPITLSAMRSLLTHSATVLVAGGAWRRGLGGDVERPLSLSLADLRGREP